MRIGRSRMPVTVDEENPYWMSFSDIMSALLVLFILAAVILILQLMEKQAEFDEEMLILRQAETVRKNILEEAAEALLARGIQVSVSENHTVLSVPNSILGFETNAYEIQPRYRDTALEIANVLSEVIRRDDRIEYLDTVFVEGHTDNRPSVGFMGKGNWGLSAFRAISLWQFWNSAMTEDSRLDRLLNKEGLPLFSVSGYAETRPVVALQQTEEDFKLNRRIDIRFTIRRPTSTEYEAMKRRLGADFQ